MRILKIYLVLTLLVGGFYGFTFFMDKSANGDDGSLVEDIEHFSQIEKGEIIPIKEWTKALIGQWEVQFTIENPTTIIDVTGITTYREDSTFTDVLALKYYEFDVYDIEKRNDYRLQESSKIVRHGRLTVPDYESSTYQSSQYFFRKLDRLNNRGRCMQNDFIDKYGTDIKFCNRVYWILRLIGNLDMENGDNYQLMKFTEDEILIHITQNNVERPILLKYNKIKPDLY